MRHDVMHMSLSDLIATVRPTDHLPPEHRATTSNADLWASVFDSIERNHVACDPAYWQRLAASIVKRQKVPVRLHHRIEGDLDTIYLLNGHHRVWALAKAGAASIRWAHA